MGELPLLRSRSSMARLPLVCPTCGTRMALPPYCERCLSITTLKADPPPEQPSPPHSTHNHPQSQSGNRTSRIERAMQKVRCFYRDNGNGGVAAIALCALVCVCLLIVVVSQFTGGAEADYNRRVDSQRRHVERLGNEHFRGFDRRYEDYNYQSRKLERMESSGPKEEFVYQILAVILTVAIGVAIHNHRTK